MKKCYLIVEEYGDHWEYYESPVMVFLSRDNAEKFVTTNSILPDLKISTEAFLMAQDIAWKEFPEETKTSLSETILKTGKFPEWSLEDLKITEEYIRREEIKWGGYRIEELDLCQ